MQILWLTPGSRMMTWPFEMLQCLLGMLFSGTLAAASCTVPSFAAAVPAASGTKSTSAFAAGFAKAIQRIEASSEVKDAYMQGLRSGKGPGQRYPDREEWPTDDPPSWLYPPEGEHPDCTTEEDDDFLEGCCQCCGVMSDRDICTLCDAEFREGF